MQVHAIQNSDARRVSTRYWWVNHGPNYRQELDGNYLWSPKTRKSAANSAADDNMARVAPGDLVLSHADGRISAVGVVTERARTAPAPSRAPEARRRRGELGWLLPVRFEALVYPLTPKDHLTLLVPTLPRRHAPIRASGERNPAVYLAEIPASMVAVLEVLLGVQLHRIEEAAAIESGDQLTHAALEEQIWQRGDLTAAAKRQLIDARLGHGVFRENVERLERGCRVTGVLDRRHLRAGHIKPWSLSDDHEKLDGCNGLLLAPHIEHLFARGHLSFADDGQVLISKHLNPSVVRAWALERSQRPQPFRHEQQQYLRFHREHVFEKQAGGRRS